MAQRIGLLKSIFSNFKNSLFRVKQKDILVGSDKYGNKYFERSGDETHNLRSSRYIEERKDLDTSDVPQVPVEWNAWLRGLRKDPPKPEEIEQNYIKMVKTKLRAAELEKKFSKGRLPESSSGSAIAEDIKSNPQHIPFPKYDDLEVFPGESSEKSSKIK